MGFILERPVVMHALTFATLIIAVFVAVITISGELVKVGDAKVIKNWLADTHGHHWVGKGIWTLILFVVFGFLGYLTMKIKECPLTTWMIHMTTWVVILSSVAITVFYYYEYTHAH